MISFIVDKIKSNKILVIDDGTGISGFRGVVSQDTTSPSVPCYVSGAAGAIDAVTNAIQWSGYDEIYIDEKVKDYIVHIGCATRDPKKYGLDLTNLISYGASPRATIFLAVAAKAHAFVQQRGYVTPQDVKSIGPDVLRHRVIVSYEAEAEDKTSEDVIQTIFDNIEVP